MASRQDYIDSVERSPKAVAEQDRQTWLGLFAEYCVIEDPVGSHPHVGGLYDRKTGARGNGPIQRFYNTFIDGNQVLFHRERDFVCGQYVMRDLELEPGGIGKRVPMHLLYELTDENGELKVKRLGAYWEVVSTMKGGGASPAEQKGQEKPKGDNPLAKMLREQGIMGTLRWMKSLRSVGDKGKSVARQFLDALNRKDRVAMAGMFADGNGRVACPAHTRWQNASEVCACGLEVRESKMLAAGSSVTCTLRIREGDRQRWGVALFEINRRSYKIEYVKVFIDEENDIN